MLVPHQDEHPPKASDSRQSKNVAIIPSAPHTPRGSHMPHVPSRLARLTGLTRLAGPTGLTRLTQAIIPPAAPLAQAIPFRDHPTALDKQLFRFGFPPVSHSRKDLPGSYVLEPGRFFL